MIDRRALITGATAAAAVASLPRASEAAVNLPPGLTLRQGVVVDKPLICCTRFLESTGQMGGVASGNPTRDDGRFLARIGRPGYTQVQLLFANYYVTSGEQWSTNAAITIAAALEYTSPVATRPITFNNGNRNAILLPGDMVWTDPVPGFLAGGASVFFRTGLTVASAGDLWPNVYTSTLADGEAFRQSTAVSSQVYNTGSLTTAGTTGGAGFGPFGAIGVPSAAAPFSQRVAVVTFGDSIMLGNGDTENAAHARGYGRGLVDAASYVIPHVVMARNSDQGNFNVDGSSTWQTYRKYACWPFATHLICNFGTNDLATGRTVNQLEADLTSIWTTAKSYGLRTAQVLINPRQVSAGGAPISGFEAGGTLRDPANAWIRSQAGNGILDAVIDVSQYVEDPNNLGKYLAGISTDGIHMNASGYNLGNVAVTAWAQTLVGGA